MIKETIVEFMKCVNMQSLQYLATLKVAILVCETKDVQNMLRGFRKTIGQNSNVVLVDCQWKKLRDEVKRKLTRIGMPNLIIDLILENLWPIGFQVFKWIVHHAEDTGIDCSSNFSWTPQFNIDYLKTAESLVENEALDMKSRFKLSCLYCLELEVRSLWQEMRLSEKRYFFKRGKLKKPDQNPIVLYWTYYIQKVPVNYWGSKILNHLHLFRYACQNGYLSATKYFLNKLKISIRNRMILNGLNIHLHDSYRPQLKVREQLAIACFLFCKTPSYTSSKANYLILLYFLEWPMQKHFMAVVNRVRQSRRISNETIFAHLLEAIIEKDLKDFKDYDYKALFIDFWHQFPEFQTYVNTNSDLGYKILMEFVKTRFGFVFEKHSFAIKAKFSAVVFRNEVSENESCFEKENVDFLKFLVRERVAIKSVIERIRNQPFHLYDNLPLGQLMHLMDGILVSAPFQL